MEVKTMKDRLEIVDEKDNHVFLSRANPPSVNVRFGQPVFTIVEISFAPEWEALRRNIEEAKKTKKIRLIRLGLSENRFLGWSVQRTGDTQLPFSIHIEVSCFKGEVYLTQKQFDELHTFLAKR
jgi:hypothetical protein